MGNILAKFRKSKSTYEVLEKLEDEINSINEFKKSTEEAQKKIIRQWLVFGGLTYVVFLVYLYFNFIYFTSNQRLLSMIPIIVLPPLIWFMKRILTWYYNKKIRKNQNKLVSLKEEKKKILDNVMEKETYKVAKTILDKFAPELKKPTIESTPSKALTPRIPQSSKVLDTGLRQRYVPQTRGRLSFGIPSSPIIPEGQIAIRPTSTPMLAIPPTTGDVASPALVRQQAARPLPAAIPPRDRSILDKMVDYLVGDGPENRFALICSKCCSHNGMAMKEEFEYMAFRCCYCSAFNPARKKRPAAPLLEPQQPQLVAATNKRADDSSSSDSDSEKNSGSDSDESAKPTEVEAVDQRNDSPIESKAEEAPESKLSNNESPMDVDGEMQFVENSGGKD